MARYLGTSFTSLVPYIRRYLADPLSVLWSDAQIARYLTEGQFDSLNAAYWNFFRFGQQVDTAGFTSLSPTVQEISRMTYQGYVIDPLTRPQLDRLSPTWFQQTSRPLYYSIEYLGIKGFQLYPRPGSTYGTSVMDTYLSSDVPDNFIISCYLILDETNQSIQLPDWIGRKLLKLYVLYKCFTQEGPGQDLKVGLYYKQRYLVQLEKSKIYLAKIFSSCRICLAPNESYGRRRPGRPIMPPNYGPIVDPRSDY